MSSPKQTQKDQHFQFVCARAGVSPTRRQASKFLQGRGLAALADRLGIVGQHQVYTRIELPAQDLRAALKNRGRDRQTAREMLRIYRGLRAKKRAEGEKLKALEHEVNRRRQGVHA